MKDIIRWILTLPAALIAMGIAYPIIWYANKIIGYFWFDIYDTFIGRLILTMMASAWSAGAFVWVGVYVAPKYKFITSIVMVSLYGILVGATLVVKLTMGDYANLTWTEVFGITFGLGAAIAVSVDVRNEEKGIMNEYD